MSSFPGEASGKASTTITSWPHKYDDIGDDGLMRCFQLWPGEVKDDLMITLITTPIVGAPPYQAISYVWETASRLEAISVMEVDNWEGFGTVYVPPNLSTALRHIREPDEAMCLWADSICINQSSLTERHSQIRHMSDIFGNALEVLIWLGPDPHGRARKAFSSDRKLLELQKHDITLTNSDKIFKDEHLLAWSWIADRPWFQRLWTMQEPGFSSVATMICGSSRILWANFHKTYDLVVHHSQGRLQRILKAQRPRIAPLYHWKDTSNLLSMVAHTQHLETSDPRDRIYALLTRPDSAVLEDYYSWERLNLEVDYIKPVTAVYTEAAIVMIRQTGTLDVLSLVRSANLGRQKFLPTWAPDWRVKAPTTPLLSKGCFACGESNGAMNSASPSFSASGELRTTGMRFGKVIWQCLASEARTVVIAESFLKTTASLPEDSIYRQVSLAQDSPEVWLHRLDLMMRRRLDWKSSNLPKVPEEAGDGLPDLKPTSEPSGKASTGRSLFLTNTGRIGLGPEQVQEGDDLFVLVSGRVPYLLRGVQGETHTLVGECCVEGMMKGQVVEDRETVMRVVEYVVLI